MPNWLIDNMWPVNSFFNSASKPCNPRLYKVVEQPLKIDNNFREKIVAAICALQEDNENYVRNAAINSLKKNPLLNDYLDAEFTSDERFMNKAYYPYEILKKLDLLYEKVLRVKESYSQCKSPNPLRLKSIAAMIQACNISYANFTAEGNDPSLITELETMLKKVREKVIKDHYGIGLFALLQNQSRMLESLDKEGLRLE